MAKVRLALSTMLAVAMTSAPLQAQGTPKTVASPAPVDSTAADTVAKSTTKKKLGRLFGKAKEIAGNKDVQNAAKGVACTVVPGAAVVGATTGTGPCTNGPLAGLVPGGSVKGALTGAASGAVAGAAAGAMGNTAAASLLGGGANARAAMATAALGGKGNATAAAAAALGARGNASAAAKSAAALAGMGGTANAAQSAAAMAAIQEMMRNAGAVSNAVSTKPGKSAARAVTPLAVASNFDFVAGERAIFFTDYAKDKPGNFPAKLNFVEGNMDVVEAAGMRFLRATTPSVLTIALPEMLPQKFTIEIDVINRPSIDGWTFQLRGGSPVASGDRTSTAIHWGSDGVAVLGGGGGEVKFAGDDAIREHYRGGPAKLRVLGDGKYIKVYLDERRLANIPNAAFEHSKLLTLRIDARGEDNPAFVGQIRVAAVK